MEIYFLRHAIAVERGEGDFSDEERPLTEKGRQKMVAAIGGIRQLDLKIDALLSSPLVRAVQTAELLREHLPYAGALEIAEELKPETPLASLLRRIGEQNAERIVLVGHEPSLSSWIRDLLGCVPQASLQLKKGGLCRLDLERASESTSSRLIYLLQPRHLRAMGRQD